MAGRGRGAGRPARRRRARGGGGAGAAHGGGARPAAGRAQAGGIGRGMTMVGSLRGGLLALALLCGMAGGARAQEPAVPAISSPWTLAFYKTATYEFVAN